MSGPFIDQATGAKNWYLADISRPNSTFKAALPVPPLIYHRSSLTGKGITIHVLDSGCNMDPTVSSSFNVYRYLESFLAFITLRTYTYCCVGVRRKTFGHSIGNLLVSLLNRIQGRWRSWWQYLDNPFIFFYAITQSFRCLFLSLDSTISV